MHFWIKCGVFKNAMIVILIKYRIVFKKYFSAGNCLAFGCWMGKLLANQNGLKRERSPDFGTRGAQEILL